MVKRIAITGPESTGKSTLAETLAKEYNTFWVPEAARMYLENINRLYEEKDLEVIARQQLEAEDVLAERASEFLFCDTEMLVMKIWSEHKFQKVHPFITSQLRQRKYHLYLLCGIDTPWQDDPLREHPDKRKFFYDWYKKELEQMNVKYIELTGSNEERVAKVKTILG